MITKTLQVVVLEAEAGFKITNLDKNIFSDKIYLGQSDSPDNWKQITNAEAETLQQAIEDAQVKEFETQEAIRQLEAEDAEKE